MTDEPTPRRGWWRRHELRINLVLTLIFVAIFIAATLLENGLLAGASVLLIIFFATYAIYGYVRRER